MSQDKLTSLYGVFPWSTDVANITPEMRQLNDGFYRKILKDIFAGGNLDLAYDYSHVIEYLDDWDPEKGFKYTFVGANSFYSQQRVKPGQHYIAKKFAGAPIFEVSIPGLFILQASQTRGIFDWELNYKPRYDELQLQAFTNTLREMFNYVLYQMMKSATPYRPKKLIDEFHKNYVAPTSKTNGVPFEMVFVALEDITGKTKPQTSPVGDAIKKVNDAIRQKKETLDYSKFEQQEYEKNIVNKDVVVYSQNKIYWQLEYLRNTMIVKFNDFIANPEDFVQNKIHDNFTFGEFDPSDIVVTISTYVAERWGMQLRQVDTTPIKAFTSALPSGVTIEVSNYIGKNEIMIRHKDYFKLFVNGRYSFIFGGTDYVTTQDTNTHQSLAILPAVIKELPCLLIELTNVD